MANQHGNGTALTDKQAIFVEHYLQCWNATEAARRAGYKGSRGTLQTIGHENLHKPLIRERIEERLTEAAMASEECLCRIAGLARVDIGEFAEVLGGDASKVLKEAKKRGLSHFIRKVKDTKEGVDLELHDALRALELIGKHHKLFTDRIEHGVEIGGTILVDLRPASEPHGEADL